MTELVGWLGNIPHEAVSLAQQHNTVEPWCSSGVMRCGKMLSQSKHANESSQGSECVNSEDSWHLHVQVSTLQCRMYWFRIQTVL